MRNKLLAIMLALIMAMVMIPTMALAEGDSWKNCTTCSEASPHMIYTTADLGKIREHTTTDNNKTIINGYFKLANDIEFSESDFAEEGGFYNGGDGWIPLDGVGWTGTSTSFSGALDGDGHSISGIISNYEVEGGDPDRYGTGLFSYLKGTVKNLTLKSFKLCESESSARTQAGALSGYVAYATVENVTVLDSEIYGSRCGAVAGYGINSSFNGCTVKNTTIHGKGNCGGIIGQVRSGMTVENCDVEVKITDIPGEEKPGWQADSGGIWGSQGYGDWIKAENRIENVNVKFKYSSTNQGYAGGLIGGYENSATYIDGNRTDVTIENAIVNVEIDTGTRLTSVGGIFGQATSSSKGNSSQITNVIVIGKINTGNGDATENTVSAIGHCQGRNGDNPSVILKNVYLNVEKTGSSPLPAITFKGENPFSLSGAVFAGQETVDGITFPVGSSYKNYKNPIEINYKENEGEWRTEEGSPETTDEFSIENSNVVYTNEEGELCGKNAGETNIAVSVTMKDKKYDLATIPVKVTPKEISVTMTNETVTYDNRPHTIEATAGTDTELPSDLTLVYSYKESTESDDAYTKIPPTAPGTYTVKVESGSANYTLVGTTTAELTISNPPVVPSGEEGGEESKPKTDVSADVIIKAPDSLIYDGSAKSYTATYDGISEWTYTYYDANGKKLDAAPANAGKYTVTIAGSNESCYAVRTEGFTITNPQPAPDPVDPDPAKPDPITPVTTVTPKPYSGGSSSGNTYSWYFNPTPSPVPAAVPVPVEIALPKTGDMTIWQSILSFFEIE